MFKGNPLDRELLELVPFLECLAKVKDVRHVIRESSGQRVDVKAEALKLLSCTLDPSEKPLEPEKLKGHQVEESGRINALGRLVTKILRHRAIKLGLELRSDGFAKSVIYCDWI
ncbi:hypothetical protein L7F22_063223 [Adiantum nelumboides]|nr:hypothetical protein [Adiantum nelumboides]